MRTFQVLAAVFLVLYAINIYVNRPSAWRHVRLEGFTQIELNRY